MDFENKKLAIKNKMDEIFSIIEEMSKKMEAEEYEEAGELYLNMQEKANALDFLFFDLAEYVL